MNYVTQQMLWYAFLSEGLLKLVVFLIGIMMMKSILRNKKAFRIFAFLVLVIPLSVLEVVGLFIKK